MKRFRTLGSVPEKALKQPFARNLGWILVCLVLLMTSMPGINASAAASAVQVAVAAPSTDLSIGPIAQAACQPTLVDRQRYGFVAATSNWSQTFGIAQLHAGWGADSTPNDTPAPGMDEVIIIRTPSGYTLNPAQLEATVDAHPGATWLISNEPDAIHQDNLFPEEYAAVYHDLYYFIKSRDRSSQVAVGGIVQATPLRLEYLDKVLAAYQGRYGHVLPADLWHIHNAVLNEERGGWGADVPPGSNADHGVIRDFYNDNDNMDYFKEQIWDFRQWMADRGYGGYPLIVSEFGVLMPQMYGYTVDRVNTFMTNTFDFLATTTDATLGDPGDGGRLVQRWAWFSLDVPTYEQDPLNGFNGNLFNPYTASITAFGTHYGTLTAATAPVNTVDLALANWNVDALAGAVAPGETVSRTMQVRIGNSGTADSGAFAVALDYAGPVSGSLSQAVASLPSVSSRWLTFTLPDLPVGSYALTLRIDSSNAVVETAECNNEVTASLVVPAQLIFLPHTLQNRGAAAAAAADAVADTLVSAATTAAAGAATDALVSASWVPDRAFSAVASAPKAVVGFTEFPLPTTNAYAGQIAFDSQSGMLWLTERDGNKIARYDPQANQWQEYNIPTAGSQPWGLDLDGQGNVWFVESATDRIGRLAMASGTISEYTGLTPGSQPWGLAFGAGAVWFTEKTGNRLGKLDPNTGQITEYPLPTGSASPGGIDVYDDDVWFAETAANKLGQFWIPREQFYEYISTPPFSPLAAPEDVVVLSSGNPWLTERLGDKITMFYMSTLQFFHPVSVPTAASEPYGIAAEGDTAIWFTERAANKLGRYGSRHLVREYPLPTANSSPTDIVLDGSGCGWYAAPGSNRIGRLCLPPQFFTYLPLIQRAVP